MYELGEIIGGVIIISEKLAKIFAIFSIGLYFWRLS